MDGHFQIIFISICRKGVGGNSIQCKKCKGWVHKKCCGIKGRLPTSGRDFESIMCQERLPGELQTGDRADQEGELRSLDMEKGEKIEVVKSFCYLRDTIEAGGGVDAAVTNRMKSAWKKFREL